MSHCIANVTVGSQGGGRGDCNLAVFSVILPLLDSEGATPEGQRQRPIAKGTVNIRRPA